MSWERKILVGDLAKECGSRDPRLLLNYLQERGLVADEAVALEDVPVGDLLRAKNHIDWKKGQLKDE